MGDVGTATRHRSGYHHGDLRNALVAAATDLARSGGPEAVVLREAARRVGVSATAAYRHFDGHRDLLLAVKLEALGALAQAMERALAEVPEVPDPGDRAVLRMRAAGGAYVGFALAEEGLYRSAFHHGAAVPVEELPAIPHAQTRPYRMLTAILDELAACGRIPARRSPLAETAAWSAMHGLAALLLDGPLRVLTAEQREMAVEYTLDMVVAGLSGA